MDKVKFDEHILGTYRRYPVALVKGENSLVWDDEGREYLDMFPGFGAGNVGHRAPQVVAAVREQLDRILHVPNVYYNDVQGHLAEKIIASSFPGKVFFCNSGTEANEGAIKFARKRNPEKTEIITLINSFHGRSFGSLSATGQPSLQEGFGPMLSGFRYCEANNVKMLTEMVSDKTAAIMIEAVLGEGGVLPLSQEFMSAAQALCHEYSCLLILDEVQTGMGRTGKMYAWQHYDVVPDIFCLAKSLGGGLPIGAFVVNDKVENVLTPGSHGSTFGGNALACAAGLGVFDALDRGHLLDAALEKGAYLTSKLKDLAAGSSRIKDIRGLGLMIGVELSEPGADLVEKFREKGILVNCTHQTVLRIMPALTVSMEQLHHFIAVFSELL